MSIETPAENVSAWTACIKENSNGLFVYATDIDEDGATIAVNWKPAPGLSELRNVHVHLDGIKKPNSLRDKKSVDIGEEFFPVRRRIKNGVVRGTIAGKPGKHGVYSSAIYIPARAPPLVVPAPPPPPPAPEKLAPLFVGQTPNCNAAIVTNHQNHMNCVNTPLGYTIKPSSAAQQLVYLGIEGLKNAGVVTTNASFHDGKTQEYGYTIREDSKLPGSQPLYAVVGCGVNDGEVTTNPHHKNCPTIVPIGWAYPW